MGIYHVPWNLSKPKLQPLYAGDQYDGPMECWLSEFESPGGGLKWEKAPKEWQNMIKFTVIETCQCRTEREIAITSLLVYNYMVIDHKQAGIYHMQLHGFFNSPNQKKTHFRMSRVILGFPLWTWEIYEEVVLPDGILNI